MKNHGNYLLDTNIIINLFKNEKNIKKRLNNEEMFFVPSIVIGELFYGAYKSERTKENIEKINNFVIKCSIIDINIDTAKEYGNIKNKLLKKGCPIPENDIWIAAVSKQYNLILFTKDGHFKEVEDIKIEIL